MIWGANGPTHRPTYGVAQLHKACVLRPIIRHSGNRSYNVVAESMEDVCIDSSDPHSLFGLIVDQTGNYSDM